MHCPRAAQATPRPRAHAQRPARPRLLPCRARACRPAARAPARPTVPLPARARAQPRLRPLACPPALHARALLPPARPVRSCQRPRLRPRPRAHARPPAHSARAQHTPRAPAPAQRLHAQQPSPVHKMGSSPSKFFLF